MASGDVNNPAEAKSPWKVGWKLDFRIYDAGPWPPGKEGPPMSPKRKLVYDLSLLVFAVTIFYGSAGPFALAMMLQQLGILPEKHSLGFKALFPLNWQDCPAVEGTSDTPDLMNGQFNVILTTLPFYFLSMILEPMIIFYVLREHERPLHTYGIQDTIMNVGQGFLGILSRYVVFLNWWSPLQKLCWENLRVTDYFADPAPGECPLSIWVCLFALDFLYYAYHRCAHQSSWLWAAHVVHHTSEEFNLSVAYRQPSQLMEFLVPDWFIMFFPLALVFPSPTLAVTGAVSMAYMNFLHSAIVPPLPIAELLWNTPSVHRVHHSRVIRGLGKNYGVMFCIWDRLFGTFEPEIIPKDRPAEKQKPDDEEHIWFGTIPQFNSWDPFLINIQHWVYMWKVQWKWHGLKTPWVKWTPPGGKCPPLGTGKMNQKQKYNAMPPSEAWWAYCALQFVFFLAYFHVAYDVSGGLDNLVVFVQPILASLPEALAFFTNSQAFLGTSVFFGLCWILHGVGACLDLDAAAGKGGTDEGTRMSLLAASARRLVLWEALRHVVFTGLSLLLAAQIGSAVIAQFAAAYAIINAALLITLHLEAPSLGKKKAKAAIEIDQASGPPLTAHLLPESSAAFGDAEDMPIMPKKYPHTWYEEKEKALAKLPIAAPSTPSTTSSVSGEQERDDVGSVGDLTTDDRSDN